MCSSMERDFDAHMAADLAAASSGAAHPVSASGDSVAEVAASAAQPAWQPIYCSLCELWVNGPEQYRHHVMASKHSRRHNIAGEKALQVALREACKSGPGAGLCAAYDVDYIVVNADEGIGSKGLTTFTGKPGKRGGKKGGKGGDGRWRQGKGNDDGKNQGKGHDDGHWRQEEEEEVSWDNTMVSAVSAHWYDDNKHWKREARCFGLAEVFSRFGYRYTAKQLYWYYLSAGILVHKRVHSPWGHGRSAPERYGFGKG